jgi:hypothetical protein
VAAEANTPNAAAPRMPIIVFFITLNPLSVLLVPDLVPRAVALLIRPISGISHRFSDAVLRAPCRTCIEGDYSIEVKRNDRPCASLDGTISTCRSNRQILLKGQSSGACVGYQPDQERSGCAADSYRPAGALNWRFLLLRRLWPHPMPRATGE